MTDKTPTSTGHYWFKHRSKDPDCRWHVIEVVEMSGGLYSFVTGSARRIESLQKSYPDCAWSIDPIPEPAGDRPAKWSSLIDLPPPLTDEREKGLMCAIRWHGGAAVSTLANLRAGFLPIFSASFDASTAQWIALPDF